VKRTGDGAIVEFRSVVDAVRCAIEVQNGMVERNLGLPLERRIEFRIGIHLGDVVEEADGDLMGDGVNIAARLESVAEPGGICLSSAAYDQVRDKLKESFVDFGEHTLKNIARPVRVYRIALAPAAFKAEKPALALPDKPSIAVLPFQNMSGDAEQNYFCDGIVEDIITGLSRINWLFVIARNSSFVYKGKPIDVKQVGSELGVRYVLEGSVRKAGNRVRITGQLIDVETGAHVWADRYDGVLEDVFDLQDRITAAIVGVIEPNLRRAEIERAQRKHPGNLGAYDLYLRALPHLATVMPEDAKIGMDYLEEALKLDPTYAVAHAWLAWAFEMRVTRAGFSEADATAGVRHARAALVYGSDDTTALAVATIPLLHLGHDFAAASGAVARALSLNNSCADALFRGAHIHAFSSDAALAEDYAVRALRVSPFDPLSFQAYSARGSVRCRAGKFDEAASFYFDSVQANPRFSTLHALQAAALALADRTDEARSAARRVLELEPSFRVRPFMEYMSAFGRPELTSPLAAGLYQTGLPE
jgi:TolB-like protein